MRSLSMREHPHKGGDLVKFQTIKHAFCTLLRMFHDMTEGGKLLRKRAWKRWRTKFRGNVCHRTIL